MNGSDSDTETSDSSADGNDSDGCDADAVEDPNDDVATEPDAVVVNDVNDDVNVAINETDTNNIAVNDAETEPQNDADHPVNDVFSENDVDAMHTRTNANIPVPDKLHVKLSQKDHRKKLLSQKGAMSRVCRRQEYSYITPRQQFPPKPARPILYIAEGAESVKHTRLLCPGQVICVESKKYLVMTIYWVGSRTQGKGRFSPRSSIKYCSYLCL